MKATTPAVRSLFPYASQNPINNIDPLGLFDTQAYVNWMLTHARHTSQGQCAKYVRQGLEAGGADISAGPDGYPNAKDYGPQLLNNDFTPVNPTDYTPQPGDTVVFQPYPGDSNSYGHIQMWNGNNWVSDFNQKGFFPNTGYSQNPTYQPYRPPAQ
jgi:CHAP domain